MGFRGPFFEGLEATKTGFYLHFCSVLWISREKLLLSYETCNMLLDCEKLMDNAVRLDFASGRFEQKSGIYPVIYAVLCVFRKIAFLGYVA